MKLRDRVIYRGLYEALCGGYLLLGAHRESHFFVPAKPRWTTRFPSGKVMHPFLAQRGVYATTAVELAVLEATLHFPPRDCWFWTWNVHRPRFDINETSEQFVFRMGYVHILPANSFRTVSNRIQSSPGGDHFGEIPDSQVRGLVYCSKRPVVPIRTIPVYPSMVHGWLRDGHIGRYPPLCT